RRCWPRTAPPQPPPAWPRPNDPRGAADRPPTRASVPPAAPGPGRCAVRPSDPGRPAGRDVPWEREGKTFRENGSKRETSFYAGHSATRSAHPECASLLGEPRPSDEIPADTPSGRRSTLLVCTLNLYPNGFVLPSHASSIASSQATMRAWRATIRLTLTRISGCGHDSTLRPSSHYRPKPGS